MSLDFELTLDLGVEAPTYATPGSSGFDMVAFNILEAYKGSKKITGDKFLKMKEGFHKRGYIKLRPFERVLFDTGIKVDSIPEGYEIQIRPRSGISLKRGILVANSPGTIDSDYKGKLGVILYNSNPYLAQVDKGEKIAQGVACKIYKLSFNTLLTERGEGGFGHSDNKKS